MTSLTIEAPVVATLTIVPEQSVTAAAVLTLSGFTNGEVPGHSHASDDVAGLTGVTVLDDAAGVTIDLSQAATQYEVTLTGNRALSFINGTSDRKVLLRVIQGGPGGWVLIPDASVAFGVDLPSIALAEAVGAESLLGFMYRHATGKSRFVAIHR